MSGTSVRAQLRAAAGLLAGLTLITGAIYPGVVTLIGHAVFASAADGTLLRRDGLIVGSALIGQPFDQPGYFWSRPSATTPPYDGGAAAASNLGPTNPALADSVGQRIARLRAADPANTGPVPVDLVTSSGSGLDPDISVAAAEYQVGRVARARGLDSTVVAALVANHAKGAVLDEPRVNVLLLNLALDSVASRRVIR